MSTQAERRIQLIQGPPGPAGSNLLAVFTAQDANIVVNVTNRSVLVTLYNMTQARTVQLPASPGAGQEAVIKVDTSGASHNVTVDGQGVLIDGATTDTVSGSRAYRRYAYDGTFWSRVG